jgi:hypothetical protein
LDSHHVCGCGGGGVGGCEDAVVEELLDVAHAEERGCRGGEKDDGLDALGTWFALVGYEYVGLGEGNGFGVGGAVAEELCGDGAVGGEVLLEGR